MSGRVFFNTEIKSDHLFENLGNLCLKPVHVLFGGRSFEVKNDNTVSETTQKSSSFLAKIAKVALAIIFFFPGLVFGTLFKAIAFTSKDVGQQHDSVLAYIKGIKGKKVDETDPKEPLKKIDPVDYPVLGEAQFGNIKFSIMKGDITKIQTDAIVNAANEALLGGGGVDGAIHSAAGRQLYDECFELPIINDKGDRCFPGDAKITGAGLLPSNYVIHTVGPRTKDEQILADCYTNSLHLASQMGLKSIAFCSIGTGIFGFPLEKATKVVMHIMSTYGQQLDNPINVTLVTFSDTDTQAYKKALDDHLAKL